MITKERIVNSKNRKALVISATEVTSHVVLTGNVGVSELGEWAEFIDKQGNVRKTYIKDILAIETKLSTDWCDCGYETFGSYPQDGECSCGMHKHHVHCGTCGKISQVG